jgi:hypothetical protein
MRHGEGNAFMDDSYPPSTIATVLGCSSIGSWVPGSQRRGSMAVGLNEINGCLELVVRDIVDSLLNIALDSIK